MTSYIEDPKERQARLKAVAQDVLRQLDTRRFVARTNIYLHTTGDDSVTLYNMKRQTDPAKVQEAVTSFKTCQVCALGAIFVSYVEKYDSVAAPSDYLIPYFDVPDVIREMFGAQNTGRIEAAFESWTEHYHDVDEWLIDNDLIDYLGHARDTAEGRLRAIMLNIIQNDGRFLGHDPGL